MAVEWPVYQISSDCTTHIASIGIRAHDKQIARSVTIRGAASSILLLVLSAVVISVGFSILENISTFFASELLYI